MPNKRQDQLWKWLALALAIPLSLPLIAVFASFVSPQWSVWQHLYNTVLGGYVYNSLVLAAGVGVGSLLIGSSLAWLMVRYRFYGRSVMQWLVLLPMAMPAYIIAYCYTGLLDVAGPLQSALRETFGLSVGEYWFADIRSLGGAIVLMSLVLYPYVYLLAKTAFQDQGPRLEEASRLMGLTGVRYWVKVALPMARPALVAGVALAMMEALADYGTVEYFGVSTFTTGIFRTWFAMGNGVAAAQLASLLCSIVFVLILWEKSARQKMAYHAKERQPHQYKIHRFPVLVVLFIAIWPFLGFVLPALILLSWAIEIGVTQLDASYFRLVFNSFTLALVSSLLVLLVAFTLAYAKRLVAKRWLSNLIRFVAMGYAIPGTVIAVGLLLPLGALDRGINSLSISIFDYRPGLVLSGTLFALLLAYVVRFLTLSLNQLETGLQRINPNLQLAANALGVGPGQAVKRVYLPMLNASMLSALILVFVDVMKELPATLILRPFNFNTLAVRTYELAAEERLQHAALPALAIVLVGIVPVIMLTKMLNKRIA